MMARASTLLLTHQADKARVALQECLQLARLVNDSRYVLTCLGSLWDVAAQMQHFEQALSLGREFVAMARSDRFKARLAVALCALSHTLTCA